MEGGQGGDLGREGRRREGGQACWDDLTPKVAGCFALCKDWGPFRLSSF